MSNLTLLENTKLVTKPTSQTLATLLELTQSSPFEIDKDFVACIFTSNTPIDNYPENEEVYYEVSIKDITTVFDTYLNKEDLVILLESPKMKETQLRLIASGEKSVYNNELPCIVLKSNFVRRKEYVAFMNSLHNLITQNKYILYFKGEYLFSSTAYIADESTENLPNTLQNEIGKQK